MNTKFECSVKNKKFIGRKLEKKIRFNWTGLDCYMTHCMLSLWQPSFSPKAINLMTLTYWILLAAQYTGPVRWLGLGLWLSFKPGYALRRWTESSLVQVRVCCLFGTGPSTHFDSLSTELVRTNFSPVLMTKLCQGSNVSFKKVFYHGCPCLTRP